MLWYKNTKQGSRSLLAGDIYLLVNFAVWYFEFYFIQLFQYIFCHDSQILWDPWTLEKVGLTGIRTFLNVPTLDGDWIMPGQNFIPPHLINCRAFKKNVVIRLKVFNSSSSFFYYVLFFSKKQLKLWLQCITLISPLWQSSRGFTGVQSLVCCDFSWSPFSSGTCYYVWNVTYEYYSDTLFLVLSLSVLPVIAY